MPKKSGPYVGMARHMTSEQATLPQYRELSQEEREAFRLFVNSNLWENVLNNARCERPTSFPAALDTALGLQIGNNQLHRKQGWEMFEAALIKQAIAPAPKKKALPETYPDAGRIDHTKRVG